MPLYKKPEDILNDFSVNVDRYSVYVIQSRLVNCMGKPSGTQPEN